MSLTVITPPTGEALGLGEAKDHCRIDGCEHDARLAQLILAARVWAEEYTGRKLMTQTIDLVVDRFAESWKCPHLVIPTAPVQSITSVNYVTGGVETVLDPATYEADLGAAPPTIRAKDGAAWPGTDTAYNAVRVRFVAGYPSLGDRDLHLFRQAMLLHVEANLDRDEKTMAAYLQAAEDMLWPYRLYL